MAIIIISIVGLIASLGLKFFIINKLGSIGIIAVIIGFFLLLDKKGGSIGKKGVRIA